MQRIATFWGDQVVAEYGSAAISALFSQWLLKVGASPDLVKQCLDIAKDEVDHAQLCHQVLLASGHPIEPALSEAVLQLDPVYDDFRKDVLAIWLRVYCLGETVAVPLFSAMKKQTTQPEALQAYARILHDEPRHSGFGWLGLAWANATWPETVKWLPELFPQALRAIAMDYYVTQTAPQPLSSTERAWGLLPQEDYGHIFEKAVLRLYAKHLRFYAIDVESIWLEVKQDVILSRSSAMPSNN